MLIGIGGSGEEISDAVSECDNADGFTDGALAGPFEKLLGLDAVSGPGFVDGDLNLAIGIPGPLLASDELFEGERGGFVSGFGLNRNDLRVAVGTGDPDATNLTGHEESVANLRPLFALVEAVTWASLASIVASIYSASCVVTCVFVGPLAVLVPSADWAFGDPA